ncbi:MAG: hypothetical protein JXB46_09065, partial [Candidatus Eisenbacteria bacterium]|nr:hypothetical protein [Candidatus Eisenbacteria bacterium]
MTDIARRPLTAVMLLLVAALLSGCIVCIDDIGCCDRNPRQATLYVYVRDYYSGASISWAYVELYESDWWSWDHVGTWDVDRYGYARVRDGYL